MIMSDQDSRRVAASVVHGPASRPSIPVPPITVSFTNETRQGVTGGPRRFVVVAAFATARTGRMATRRIDVELFDHHDHDTHTARIDDAARDVASDTLRSIIDMELARVEGR